MNHVVGETNPWRPTSRIASAEIYRMSSIHLRRRHLSHNFLSMLSWKSCSYLFIFFSENKCREFLLQLSCDKRESTRRWYALHKALPFLVGRWVSSLLRLFPLPVSQSDVRNFVWNRVFAGVKKTGVKKMCGNINITNKKLKDRRLVSIEAISPGDEVLRKGDCSYTKATHNSVTSFLFVSIHSTPYFLTFVRNTVASNAQTEREKGGRKRDNETN